MSTPYRFIATICAAMFLYSSNQLALSQEGPEQKAAADSNHGETTVFSEEPSHRYRPYLGVAVEQLPPAFASQLPNLVKKEQGLVVTGVAEGSPAESAGIRTHDILLTYDDQRLCCVEQLGRLLTGDEPGREVSLGLVREAKLISRTLELGKQEFRDESSHKEAAERTQTSEGFAASRRHGSRAPLEFHQRTSTGLRADARDTTGRDVNRSGRDYFGNYGSYYDTDQPQQRRRDLSRRRHDSRRYYRPYYYRFPGYPGYLYRYPYATRYPFDRSGIGLPWYLYVPYF